jgi:hypothetical protein
MNNQKKLCRRESDGVSRNDPLQQDWVEITRFRFRGSLFSASSFFFFFWRHFSASGLSNFWRGRHFPASGLSNLWQFFGGFLFAIFQLLVLAIFGAGAIFQLLVLAIFGNFLEDLFLQH